LSGSAFSEISVAHTALSSCSSHHVGRRGPGADQPERVVTSEIEQRQGLQDPGITGHPERNGSVGAVRMVFTALPVPWIFLKALAETSVPPASLSITDLSGDRWSEILCCGAAFFPR